MKKTILSYFVASLITSAICAQVQIDKPIQLTGSSGLRSITNLEAPVNGTDATNKAYVDATVAAGAGSSLTMISNESATTMNFGDAMRYCRNLTESGNSDWRLPTFTELTTLVSKGGTTVSSESSANNIWLAERPSVAAALSTSYQTHFQWIRLSDGSIASGTATNLNYVRCVR